jgi:hypothetical protein
MTDIKKSAVQPLRVYPTGAAMFLVRCCCRGGTISGEISNAYFRRRAGFGDLGQMLLTIDDICQANNYPESDTVPRYFKGYSSHARRNIIREMSEAQGECSPYEWRRTCADEQVPGAAAGEKGKKAEFRIHVIYRQNSTIQGVANFRPDSSTEVCFRSGLELIRMIESFMNE